MFDGDDQKIRLQDLYGEMSSVHKWVISSSGHHMFIKFVVDLYNYGPGFLANFHFGIKQY